MNHCYGVLLKKLNILSCIKYDIMASSSWIANIIFYIALFNNENNIITLSTIIYASKN